MDMKLGKEKAELNTKYKSIKKKLLYTDQHIINDKY